MAKEWSQFLQPHTEAHSSTMPPTWRHTASECMQGSTMPQRTQHHFVKRSLCGNGADGCDYAALSSADVVSLGSSANLMPSQLATSRDLLRTLRNSIEYQHHNHATSAGMLSPVAQQLSISQAIDNRCDVLDIMDNIPLQPQSKVISPLSMSSSCGCMQAPSTQAGGIASSDSSSQSPSGSAKYNNVVSGAMTSNNPASASGIDCNSKHVAGYNAMMSCGPGASQIQADVGADHKLAARHNNAVLGIGPSQNHAITGLDRKLAASYNEILSGTHASHNHDAYCTGYNDILSIPDSKLASSWLASGGSQDLSPEEKEMIYRAAAMQPIDMNTLGNTSGAETEVDKPKPRRNVRISKDPQSIAARQRRQRISSKMRVLQKLVPRGMKMDTASMLEEAAHYLKFLKAEVEKMEAIEQLINVAKGHLDCRLGQGPPSILGASSNAMKPKSSLNSSLPLIPSGPQASLLCNPPSSQYPHYLNQASLTF